MDAATLQLLLGVAISALLLWQGIVLRQFSKTVDKLEVKVEAMGHHVSETRERLIRVEAKVTGAH